MQPGRPIVALVGPTASGKSRLSLDLAEALAGEVVNADAMQLYRGMDIGTAKLPPGERRGIPHHQLDVLGVSEEASVAAYQRSARADIAAIQSRGHQPLVVGGSGLYVRAVLDVLDIPPTDPAVRGRLEREARELGTTTILARLRQLDPAAAAHIEPDNARRIVRALEVVELTGRPFSAALPRRAHLQPTVTIGLVPDRGVLDERINARVARMWRDGLLEEVKSCDRQGIRLSRTSSRALGYRQALAQLDGLMAEDEAQQATASATRCFARRQLSWFRPDPRVHWLDPSAPDLLDRALSVVRTGIRENGEHG